MTKKRKETPRNLVMLPNGKQPLSSTKDWEPEGSYSSKKDIGLMQRIGLVATLLVVCAALTAVSAISG
jgi:hypothetical protein